MIGLVINKMTFEGKDGKKFEGINLTCKGQNGYYLSKTPDKSKLKFYPVPHDVFINLDVGKVYEFSFSVNVDTGNSYIEDADLSSF